MNRGFFLFAFFYFLNCQIKLDFSSNSEKLGIVFDNSMISPECDIAQNKRRYYKFIRGCVISKNLIEKILSDTFYENKFKFKKEDGKVVFKFNDTIFNALEFKHKSYQNSSVYLILDFSQITTIPVTDTTITEKEVLFSINSDMLSTIKNKLAAVIYKKGYQHL